MSIIYQKKREADSRVQLDVGYLSFFKILNTQIIFPVEAIQEQFSLKMVYL